MYQALYRKWRPKTFDDVVGQEHITVTLKNEVAAGKPSHAYLFCGTRGTGKTTCSKILAKAVNCPNQTDGNPCCECDICRGVEDDSILDVTEIDAASNSGVDNIRDLREEANFTPAMTRYRVYIIDECHMLSTGAFNALLKIMEEPPEHVLFILATTEIHKVPATILSRCQRFDFKRIASETIAAHLLHIARTEGLTLHEDAALLIARLADGGMRDAQSLLDLCLTGGEEITTEVVGSCAGLVGQEHLFGIAGAVEKSDIAGALAVLEGLWEKSIDYQRLCEQLIGFYRNLMIAGSVPKPEELIACLPGELEQYRAMAKDLSMDRILHCLTLLQDTLARMGRTSMRRTELEMGLLKLASPELAQSSLTPRIEKLEQAVRAGVPARGPAQQATPAGGKAKPVADPSPTEEEISKTQVEPFAPWSKVLDVLKEKNKALYGALVNSAAYTGSGLLLVDAGEGSMFAQMVRGDSYAKESLRDAVLAVTGEKFRLGPYNPQKYDVKPVLEDKLTDLLKKASDLGVDVQVKE